ncbi:hypothetical protein CEXT_330351 [Caerostris extrusa]|uniref:Uncharacterized protein n=1 Tax=Caerostris extrusa TaxID=172846 RepID=A0AAV4XEV8_CAEEX|nr:hypothetical protein CEXT_330351 [Caerostris extrusa]
MHRSGSGILHTQLPCRCSTGVQPSSGLERRLWRRLQPFFHSDQASATDTVAMTKRYNVLSFTSFGYRGTEVCWGCNGLQGGFNALGLRKKTMYKYMTADL